jgi:hypothetical protein
MPGQKLTTLSELRAALEAADISDLAYSFESDGCGEVYRLARESGRWAFYYAERGQRSGLLSFDSEAEAVQYFFQQITSDPSTTRTWLRTHRSPKT